MNEDMEQLHVKVPEDVKRRAKSKLPHGGLSDLVRDTLKRAADGNAERYKLREELTDLRDEREELKQERAAIDRKLTDITRKIERKEEKLEQHTDPNDEYKGYLQSLLEDMQEYGMRVDPGHGKVQKAANMIGKTPEAVIQDMEEMAEEMPDSQFRESEEPYR